jgi:hypothetical protein
MKILNAIDAFARKVDPYFQAATWFLRDLPKLWVRYTHQGRHRRDKTQEPYYRQGATHWGDWYDEPTSSLSVLA